jgi:peptidoglycan/LPS O-acetylase OafA/YrhL
MNINSNGKSRIIKAEQFAFLPTHLACLLDFAATWLTALVFTIAASSLTYFVIEKPGIKLGNKIIERLEAKQAFKHS